MNSKPNSATRPAVEFCVIFAFYVALTIVIFWQLLPFLHNSLIGPAEDNMQDFWNTWYTAAANRGSHFFYTNLIKFPEGTSLYYHSFAYPKIFAIWLITRIVETKTSTLILLQNLSILLSFPLAGVGAFYVVRRFVFDNPSALVGGFIYAFNPSHIAHALHHVGVSSIEFIPFFVLSYLSAASKRSVWWLALAICFYCLSSLSCWYYLFYIGYFILFQTGYLLYSTPQANRGWTICLPILTVAGTIVSLSPLLLPMISEAFAGANVYLPGGEAADVITYFTFPPAHIFPDLTDHLYSRLPGNPWELTVYLGLVNIALLAWAVFHVTKESPEMLLKQRRLFVYVVSGMAIFAVLASGTSLHVLGHSTFPMPDRLLDKLPFFRNVRTPSRAITFVYLFLAIGVGQAYELLLRPGTALGTRHLVGSAVAVLIFLDFYPAHLSTTTLSCSPGFSIIKNDAEQNFGVLTLPTGYVSDNASMAEQRCHGRPIVGDNIAREVTRTLRDRLEMANLKVQRQQLSANRIKYIVINRSKEGLFEWGEGALLQDYCGLYPILYKDADIIILKVY